jgi:hypothetical protein
MWLFTKAGFFSAVVASEDRKQIAELTNGFDFGGSPTEPLLAIRARVESDLDRLRAYAPKLGPTVLLGEHRDYPYRAYITKEAWAETLCRLALDVDYNNFKGMVVRVFGSARYHLYHLVWDVMDKAEKKLGNGEKKPPSKQAQNAAAKR